MYKILIVLRKLFFGKEFYRPYKYDCGCKCCINFTYTLKNLHDLDCNVNAYKMPLKTREYPAGGLCFQRLGVPLQHC